MDQDNVVGVGPERGQGVGNGFLPVVAAFHNMHSPGQSVLACVLGNLGLDALHLRLANGHEDCRYPLNRCESAERVDKDGDAIEGQKLLGLRPGHPCTKARSGKNYEYLHNW